MSSGGVLHRSVAPQAWPVGIGLLFAAAAAGFFGLVTLAGLLVLLAAGHFAFFRNPKRVPPPGEGLVVSPADGKVVEIVELDDPFVGPAVRVAIFLSVFNVHVNRAPIAGKVRAVRRSGSKFLAAFDKQASDLNVQARLDLETPTGVRAAVVQITGLIARRIVCYPSEGDVLLRGEPFGLIHYGSRAELYLPAGTRIVTQVGQKVSAGTSVLAELSL